MDKLALTIGGTTVPVPSAIQHVSDRAGPFGQNIWQLGIRLLIFTGVVVALFILVWSGIQWITSGGDKQKLQAARSRLTYSIVGLIVVFLAFIIVSIVGNFFSINLVGNSPTFPGGVPNCQTRGDCANRPTPTPILTIPNCRARGDC